MVRLCPTCSAFANDEEWEPADTPERHASRHPLVDGAPGPCEMRDHATQQPCGCDWRGEPRSAD